MLYRQETPFDKLSYVALVYLEEVLHEHGEPLAYSGIGHNVYEEVVAAMKAKAFSKNYFLPKHISKEI